LATISNSNAVLIAEYRFLNALYNDPKIFDNITVDENILQHDICKSIFKAEKELYSEKVPLTKSSIFERFSAIDGKATIDVVSSIIGISNEKTAVIDDIIGDLNSAKKITDASTSLYKIIEKLNKTPRISKEDSEDISDELFKLQDSILNGGDDISSIYFKEWFDKYISEFEKRKDGKIYKFGNEVFDKMITDGPTPGSIGLIVGSTGMGKSAVCLNLIDNCINSNIPVMYFPIEMGDLNTMDRLLAKRLGIPYSHIVNPEDDSDFEAIKAAILSERKKLDENKLFKINENPNISLDSLAKEVKIFQKEIGQKYMIVFVDLLSMVLDFCNVKAGTNLAQTIEFALNKLNALSKTLGVHFVGTLQLNRTTEADKVIDVDDIEKLKPSRSAIKNAGAFLERVRWCVSIFRPMYYAKMYLDPEDYDELSDKIQLSLLKQNNGECHPEYMLYDGETFSCTPIATEESTDSEKND